MNDSSDAIKDTCVQMGGNGREWMDGWEEEQKLRSTAEDATLVIMKPTTRAGEGRGGG